jgi:hypothetical protein
MFSVNSTVQYKTVLQLKCLTLKGQSHEKVDEIRSWGSSLGSYQEQKLFFYNFSDRPLNSCEFLKG